MARTASSITQSPTGVRLCDVGVSYGSRAVLSGVDLSVAPGEWLGLIGPNGAGKSTLLRAIAGLVEASGTIGFDEFPTRPNGRRGSQLVAYLPQRPELPPTMSVDDYILLGRSPHISLFASERPSDHRAVASVIERLELDVLRRRPLGELSGGEAQRVVLARALAQGAPVLLLDEPSTALDLGQGQRVLELVDELRKERSLTVISAMHDLGIVGQYADRLAVVVAGRLVATGSSREVLTESAIATYYGASVQLIEGSDGGVVVVPMRRRVPTKGVPPTS